MEQAPPQATRDRHNNATVRFLKLVVGATTVGYCCGEYMAPGNPIIHHFCLMISPLKRCCRGHESRHLTLFKTSTLDCQPAGLCTRYVYGKSTIGNQCRVRKSIILTSFDSSRTQGMQSQGCLDSCLGPKPEVECFVADWISIFGSDVRTDRFDVDQCTCLEHVGEVEAMTLSTLYRKESPVLRRDWVYRVLWRWSRVIDGRTSLLSA